MSVIVCAEDTTLSALEWQNKLRIGQSEFIYLVGKKILRPKNSDIYSLTFVGVIIFNHGMLFSRPKFDEANLFSVEKILAILRGYFLRSRSRQPLIEDLQDPEYGNIDVLREYDALINLRNWFANHGLYRREASSISNKGRPHWIKTFAKKMPLMMQNSILYPSIIAERREGVINEISSLQVGILCRLMERYGLNVSSELAHTEIATGSIILKWPPLQDARAYFLQKISSEKRNIFRSDSIQLMNLLQSILDSKLAAPINHPQVFGTTAFYAVWEDACRIKFGNIDGNINEDLLGQPTWFIKEKGGGMQSLRHQQIPDLVFIQDSSIYIMDAKYYYPFPSSRPGGPDIIKQLYYADSLKMDKLKIRSLFLMPVPDVKTIQPLGIATIDGANKIFANVEAWGVDPMWIFHKYPQGINMCNENFFG